MRDRNWGTIKPLVTDFEADRNLDSFQVSFTVTCREREIDFVWQGELSGTATGRIVYAMRGRARSSFLRNRIGFCVLHPIAECAGRPCTLEKTDEAIEESRFPDAISPHQPFTDLRARTREVVPGVSARGELDGEVFETEDQRNRTDATYKTYSTPLERPFPVMITAGESVEQTVTLDLQGALVSAEPPASAEPQDAPIRLTPGPTGRLPRLGLVAADHGVALTDRELERLARLRLDHLRVDVRPSDPCCQEALVQASRDAERLGTSLHVALTLAAGQEADDLLHIAALMESLVANVSALLVFHERETTTTSAWIELARKTLNAVRPAAAIAGGTNAYFTELNRRRPPARRHGSGPAVPDG